MKKLYYLIPVFLVSQIAIFYAALMPLTLRTKAEPGISWIITGPFAHFAAFFVTTLLLVSILKEINFRYPIAGSFVYSLVAAVLIEYLQLIVGYRTFDWMDVGWGMGGSFVYIIFNKNYRNFYKLKF